MAHVPQYDNRVFIPLQQTKHKGYNMEKDHNTYNNAVPKQKDKACDAVTSGYTTLTKQTKHKGSKMKKDHNTYDKAIPKTSDKKANDPGSHGYVNSDVKKEPRSKKSDYDYAKTLGPATKKPDDYIKNPQEPGAKEGTPGYISLIPEPGAKDGTPGYISLIPATMEKQGNAYSKISGAEKPPKKAEEEDIYADIVDIGLVERVRKWEWKNHRKVVVCIVVVAVVIALLVAGLVTQLVPQHPTAAPTASACNSSSCLNNGICVDIDGGYKCTCPFNFTGDTCETEIIPCSANTCLHGGTCVDTTSGFTCSCKPIYTGRQCETEICALGPCRNGARCVLDADTGYICVCRTCACESLPRITPTCDIDKSSICKNASSAKNTTVFPYDCHKYVQCKQNGEFVKVETVRIKNWVYNPDTGLGVPVLQCATLTVPEVCGDETCFNNGNCSNTQLGFKCACPFGFIGQKCETETEKCNSATCHNGGTCADTTEGIQCTCPDGYTDSRCGTESCSTERCLNGGTCRNTNYGYQCRCRTNFFGKNCENEFFRCESDWCMKGGSCSNSTLGISCHCLPDITGDRCETNIACESKPLPCKFGTCNILEVGFNCTCESCNCSTLEIPNLKTCFLNGAVLDRLCKEMTAQHPDEVQWFVSHPYRCERYIQCYHSGYRGADKVCPTNPQEYFNPDYKDLEKFSDVCIKGEESECGQQ